MSGPTLALAAAAVGLAAIVYVIVAYNGLVNLRNLIGESWSDVETELKRRYDLVPNLVSTVKGYAVHEKDVLERVVAARAKALCSTGGPGSRSADENVLIESIKQLLAVVERYPDLRASEHYLELQQELSNTEDRIQAARRFFNGNVRDYNNKVEMFPSRLVAWAFGFRRHDFFEIAGLERSVPKVG